MHWQEYMRRECYASSVRHTTNDYMRAPSPISRNVWTPHLVTSKHIVGAQYPLYLNSAIRRNVPCSQNGIVVPASRGRGLCARSWSLT